MKRQTSPAPWLKPLPPEPWGRRLKRAREDVADLTLQEAALKVGHWTPTSDATLSRLESRDEAPDRIRPRQTAYIACMVYGVDPGELGLGDDDLPPRLSESPALRRKDSYACTTRGERFAPVVELGRRAA